MRSFTMTNCSTIDRESDREGWRSRCDRCVEGLAHRSAAFAPRGRLRVTVSSAACSQSSSFRIFASSVIAASSALPEVRGRRPATILRRPSTFRRLRNTQRAELTGENIQRFCTMCFPRGAKTVPERLKHGNSNASGVGKALARLRLPMWKHPAPDYSFPARRPVAPTMLGRSLIGRHQSATKEY